MERGHPNFLRDVHLKDIVCPRAIRSTVFLIFFLIQPEFMKYFYISLFEKKIVTLHATTEPSPLS